MTLIDTVDHLAVALTGDPLLLLAAAVAAFDPFRNEFGDDGISDECNPLFVALSVTRSAFPDIYAEAVEQMRSNVPHHEIENALCRAITAKGIPIDDLEMMSWGIPLAAFGVDLEDPEFYAVHSDVLPALIPFGIKTLERETDRIDLPDPLHNAGRQVASSLQEQDEPALKQVGWLYAWLFGCSGNSLVDVSNEDLDELQPLSWSPDDVAFAIEMIEEADVIMSNAMAGLQYLTASPGFRAALERNVASVYRVLQKKGKRNDPVRLDWPRLGNGTD